MACFLLICSCLLLPQDKKRRQYLITALPDTKVDVKGEREGHKLGRCDLGREKVWRGVVACVGEQQLTTWYV